jgi:hypothetical protein
MSKDSFTPLDKNLRFTGYLEAILKTPKRLFTEIKEGNANRAARAMILVTALCLAVYGLITGCFSGGNQLLWAPIKIIAGVAVSGIICFPSLYIFTCLSRVDMRIDQLFAHFVSALALSSILLVGLAPVLFVFTVSTESIGFMGVMHLFFWGIAGIAGSKFLLQAFYYLRGRPSVYSVWWVLIFIIVLLQMSTTLRPILGSSEHILSSEKKFFLGHWLEEVIRF